MFNHNCLGHPGFTSFACIATVTAIATACFFLPKMAMAPQSLSPLDPSSYSRPELVVVTNIFLSLDANFDRKVFNGSVDLTVKKIDESVNELILDVNKIKLDSILDKETGKKLEYDVGKTVSGFGSKLVVKLPPNPTNNYVITINYETSPEADGLQWLTPQQTAGKQHPYLFSQFEAIAARSFVPCQDTPLVKAKYQANISVPRGLTAVMSAICDSSKPLKDKQLFHFVQDIPVQSYLIAIAIGALESRDIGPRSKVWAEKEVVEEAAYEFANTEDYLKTAEEICGPYVWGRYDLLVLPPSFPFGGMENPCLTFVTPTLLAGDRSLANVVAHEIAHSWSGNLVTNANFEHFWLNEGFTVFIERRIVGKLESKQLEDFMAYGGLQELKETIDRLGSDSGLTKLVVDLRGVHPDDAFSHVPYEKGSLFLRYLENTVGGPAKFEPFLRSYFETYKFKSITTDTFRSYFEKEFANIAAIKDIDWEKWLYSTGFPADIPEYDMSFAKTCDEFSKRFVDWDPSTPIPFSDREVSSLEPQQVIQLLQNILEAEPVPIAKLRALEEKFKFKTARNSEIKFRWLRIGLKAHWEEKIDDTLDWVVEVGRMKFVRPLYRDLYKWEAARERAIQVYNSNKKNMMHVSAYTVGKDLNLVSE